MRLLPDLPPPDPRRSPAAPDDDIDRGFAPRCPHCLRGLEPDRVRSRAVWACPECGLVRIA